MRRVLTVRFRSENLTRRIWSTASSSRCDRLARAPQVGVARAQESIVLLANENHLLPSTKANSSRCCDMTVRRLCADRTKYTGEYSKFVKPLEGIQNKVGSGIKVLYAHGSGIMETETQKPALLKQFPQQSRQTSRFSSLNNQLLEREGLDREFLNLRQCNRTGTEVMAANPKTVIVLLNGGPVSLARFCGEANAQWDRYSRFSIVLGR